MSFLDDEQMTGRDSADEEDVNGKCMKLSPRLLTAPTLLDLPMEIHEHILVNAVATEVTDRRLVKHAWKQAADGVVERLKNVCPEWKYTLTTKLFQDKLHGFLDSVSPVQVSMVVLAKHRFASGVTVTALNDDVFVLCHPPQQHAVINIYDRHNLQALKGTIQLPEVTIPWDLKACSMTKCLYLLHQASGRIEIWRISKVENQFEVSPWIRCLTQLISRMSVAADGSLILFQGPAPSTITVYNSDRSIKDQINLTQRISSLQDILPKSNGNFVLVSRRFIEINREGTTVKECDIPAHGHIYCAIGMYDWVTTIDEGGRVRVLDCEFNPMDADAQLDSYGFNKHLYRVNYDTQRNEFLAFETDAFGDAKRGRGGVGRQCLTIFNFAEGTIPKDAQNEPDLTETFQYL